MLNSACIWSDWLAMSETIPLALSGIRFTTSGKRVMARR